MAGWYKTGTVSVTNGTKAVTGLGTIWINAVFAGDTFTADGDHLYEIDSVTDNLHLVLTENFGQTSLAGASYKIMPTSPLRNSTTTLVKQFGQLVDDYGHMIYVAGQDRIVNLNKDADAANAGMQLLSNDLYQFRMGIFGSNNFAIAYSPAGDNTNWVDIIAVDSATGQASGQFLMSSVQTVIDHNATVPPTTPSVGDQYYAAPGAVGAWATLNDRIVRWDGTKWVAYIPTIGQLIYDETIHKYFTYNGTTFVPAQSGLLDIVPANQGGTGVANNAASTITINGAYSLAMTLTGNTSLTFPTTGTVMTTAGIQTVTSKSIDASSNTLTNLTTAMFAANIIDDDAALTANSATRLATQRATKAYVDAAVFGLSWKKAVAVVATTNLVKLGEQTVDGYLTSISRIALSNQTPATDNGIWLTGAGVWIRSPDADTGAELAWASFLVENGTVNGGTIWSVTNPTVVIGTTNIVVAKIAGAGIIYTAGAGLTLTGGTVFSITPGGVTLAMQANFAASSIMGNPTGSSATPSAITLGTNLQFTGTTLAVVAAPTFTGAVTGASFIPTGSSVPANGMYLSAANTVALAANTTNLATLTTGGIVVGAATGSYKGAGTINAAGLFVNGVPVVANPGVYLYNTTDFVATAAQTVFTVTSYTPGYVEVYQNGSRLSYSEYTATNGTSITLLTGAVVGDDISIQAFTTLPSVISSFPGTIAFADGGTWSASGINIATRKTVRVVAVANITIASALINGSVIDGVALATGDRVLLTAQTTASQNGIYVVAASGAAVRAGDSNVSAAVMPGLEVQVTEGTHYANSSWYMVTAGPITLGTTSLSFKGDTFHKKYGIFQASKISPQSGTTGTWTQVTLDNVTLDSEGAWDATNNWYVIPKTGVWRLSGQVALSNSTFTATSNQGVIITKNGGVVTPTNFLCQGAQIAVSASPGTVIPAAEHSLTYLNVGDKIQLNGLGSGTGINFDGAAHPRVFSGMTIEWVGE